MIGLFEKTARKEWGGYLPLELLLDYNSNGILFPGVSEENIFRFNAARYALCNVLLQSHFDRLWLPMYMCKSVYEALNQYKINYVVYNIDEAFFPCLDTIPDRDVILICNYYGIQKSSFYIECQDRFRNIIFDNTQALFSPPIIRSGIHNIYSPRKFVGVSDGSFLVSQSLISLDALSEDRSSTRNCYLIESIEKGTNGAYSDYLKSEESLANEIKRMSKSTRIVLEHIDFSTVQNIRMSNFKTLSDRLCDYNELNIGDIEYAPVCYPLFFKSDSLRNDLVSNRVYVPQWWKWVEEDNRSNQFEKELSRWVVPLPIDQRYSVEDMQLLADIVIEYLER